MTPRVTEIRTCLRCGFAQPLIMFYPNFVIRGRADLVCHNGCHRPRAVWNGRVVLPPPFNEADCMRYRRLEETIANLYSLPDDFARVRSRTAAMAEARLIVCYLLVEVYGRSPTRTGEYISRDHSSVLHGRDEIVTAIRRARPAHDIARARGLDTIEQVVLHVYRTAQGYTKTTRVDPALQKIAQAQANCAAVAARGPAVPQRGDRRWKGALRVG